MGILILILVVEKIKNACCLFCAVVVIKLNFIQVVMLLVPGKRFCLEMVGG
jgi:hypothetical protein